MVFIDLWAMRGSAAARLFSAIIDLYSLLRGTNRKNLCEKLEKFFAPKRAFILIMAFCAALLKQ